MKIKLAKLTAACAFLCSGAVFAAGQTTPSPDIGFGSGMGSGGGAGGPI